MHYMCCVVVQSANNRKNGGGEILRERPSSVSIRPQITLGARSFLFVR